MQIFKFNVFWRGDEIIMNIYEIENVLKEVYLGVISNQLNTQTDLVLAKIKQTTDDVYGKRIIKPVNINGKDFVFTEELSNFYASFEISDKAIRASQNSLGAFVNLLNNEMEYMLKDTQRRLQNSFYTEDTRPNYIRVNEKYEPLKVAGLKELFDTNLEKLYGVDRKSNPEINPVIKNIDKFDPIKIQEIIDEYNDEVNVIICSHRVKREYMEYLIKHKQNIDVTEFNGGFRCLKFNGSIPMYPQRIPDNEIYLLNTKDFELCQLCDWLWLDNREGNILIPVEGKPVYHGTLVKYGNYICTKPYKQIKIILGK